MMFLVFNIFLSNEADDLLLSIVGLLLFIIYIIIWFRLSVCMYVCLYVIMLNPHNSRTNGRIFKIQTPIIRVRCRIGHTTFRFGNLLPVWPGKWKMTFKTRFLAHNLSIYGRILKIQTAYVQDR